MGEGWKKVTSTSRNTYFLLNRTLPGKEPHIFNILVGKQYSATITRPKLNHGTFPGH